MSDKRLDHVSPGLTLETASALVTVAEAAVILGLGRETTYSLVREKKLLSIRLKRKILIPLHEIKRYIGKM